MNNRNKLGVFSTYKETLDKDEEKLVGIVPVLWVCALLMYSRGPFGKTVSQVALLVSVQIILYFVVVLMLRRTSKQRIRRGGDASLDAQRSVRARIVSEFIDKYGIPLEKKQVWNMVDASYGSPRWEKEIAAMDVNYKSISEYYSGGEEWLRLYLLTFKSIQIYKDPDMQYQRRIVIDAFCQIISEPLSEQITIDECVRKLNQKYFAVFDEELLLAVCRYMKRNRYDVRLPEHANVRYVSDIEKLVAKYRTGVR